LEFETSRTLSCYPPYKLIITIIEDGRDHDLEMKERTGDWGDWGDWETVQDKI